MIQRYKRLSRGSIDPENVARYEAKLREWEVKKRDLLTSESKRSMLNINVQLFAKRIEDFETVFLPKNEYAHIMSEIATNLTEEQAQKRVFSKAIGNYIYTVENCSFGDYRVIKKIKIEEDI